MKKKIRTDLQSAQKARDVLVVSTLRFLLAEVHNEEMAKQEELKDEEIIQTIRRQIKKRQEAIEAYQKGQRDDLAEKEKKEAKILSKYLPQQMPIKQLEKLVKEVIDSTKAQGPKDFGKVMAKMMDKIRGQVKGSQVAELVKKQLDL